MLLFGGLATLGTVPLMYAIADVKNPLAAYGLIVVALAVVSFYTSISGLVKSEMFPPEVRAMSVGLAYAIANAIFAEVATVARPDTDHRQHCLQRLPDRAFVPGSTKPENNIPSVDLPVNKWVPIAQRKPVKTKS